MLSQHWQLVKNESISWSENCLPTTLVGALVNGKPNYVAITHAGIIDFGSVSLGMNKNHYANGGIKMNRTFSFNFPSVKLLVKETDYCVLMSKKTWIKPHVLRFLWKAENCAFD